ncbi:hypothetical protein [Methylobrevis pamukkalensis]|uniref:Uncharacterized protein n=1 Tax=Methylobrevis pamukkalensis TaxID=1439726 RepID=A0A1E3H0W9_9HYPH|nr:hypothetical protein [Methylobrevis pamukkalensis]ODN69221.1 hypothetical protein A6302_03483 [Methylobrevis pamukkalensis]
MRFLDFAAAAFLWWLALNVLLDAGARRAAGDDFSGALLVGVVFILLANWLARSRAQS